MPDKDMRSIKQPLFYEALKRKGMSKEKAAKISNGALKRKLDRQRVAKSD